MAAKPGLYANINAKRERIAEGSGEKMRKVGAKGAPTAKAFKESAKTAKKPAKMAMGGKVTYVKKKDGNKRVKIC
jgi:signal recognition particle GTPase